MKRITTILAVSSVSMWLAACSDSEVQVIPSDDPAQILAQAGDGSANIVDTAVAAGSFNTLTAALQATGLDAILADETRSFTVFAPTDAAFEALGQDTIDALLNGTDTLSDIFLYHVVADASVDAATAVTLAGQSVTMANLDDVALSGWLASVHQQFRSNSHRRCSHQRYHSCYRQGANTACRHAFC